jgi:hydroxyacylglutathione hydrolase
MLAALDSQQEFVESCLDLRNLPAVPPYWKRMRKQNQEGPPLLGTLREPPALRVNDFKKAWDAGAVILDCRSPEAFGGAHIPGALNVGAGSSFPTWAGTVLPSNRPYLLVIESEAQLWDLCWELLRIGYELPQGWLSGGMLAWRTAAKPIATIPQWSVWDLRDRIESERKLVVLDVRQPQEWAEGHIEHARHITGAELPQRINEVPEDVPVAVICGSGYRSSVSSSLLASNNYKNIANVLGGMSAWKKAGFPTIWG